MTQPTDEAAVDIVERLRAYSSLHDHLSWRSICEREAADEIETLRAKLTAATRRAEQAERMLAEALTKIDNDRTMWNEEWLVWTQDARDHFAIRSAASGEQG